MGEGSFLPKWSLWNLSLESTFKAILLAPHNSLLCLLHLYFASKSIFYQVTNSRENFFLEKKKRPLLL